MGNKPFDFVNAILLTKENDMSIDGYVPFLTNRALSQYPDTLPAAQEINFYNQLTNEQQFQYLINIIRPKRRPFKKWAKKVVTDEIGVVQQYYNISYNKAKTVLSILSKQQIKELKKRLEEGGVK